MREKFTNLLTYILAKNNLIYGIVTSGITDFDL